MSEMEKELCRYCGGAGKFQIVSSVSDRAWATCFCSRVVEARHSGVREALERQMEAQDEYLPSSIAREQGLVWLDGWFDISAALATNSVKQAQQYEVGPLTFKRVFAEAKLANISDMQAVLNAVESALYLLESSGLVESPCCCILSEYDGEPIGGACPACVRALATTPARNTSQIGEG